MGTMMIVLATLLLLAFARNDQAYIDPGSCIMQLVIGGALAAPFAPRISCPINLGSLRILSFIENASVIGNIMLHFRFWNSPKRRSYPSGEPIFNAYS